MALIFNDKALKGSVYKGPKFCRFGLKGRVIFKTFVFAQKKKKKRKKRKKTQQLSNIILVRQGLTIQGLN